MDVPTTLAGCPHQGKVLLRADPTKCAEILVLTQPTVRGCCWSQPWEGR